MNYAIVLRLLSYILYCEAALLLLPALWGIDGVWLAVTAAELADTSGVPYLEEYDAWYTFTSDFGPGKFLCAGGEVDEAAGTARLWTEPREDGGRAELALQRDGESWHIRSHRIVNNP